MKDGYRNECKDCENIEQIKRRATNNFNKWQIEYRSTDKGKCVSKKYYKSYQGRVNRAYLGMKERANSKKLYCMSKEEFICWCDKNDVRYKSLYDIWKQSHFTMRTTPTIDRIDNSKGYSLDNIRWCTMSENASKQDKDISLFRPKPYILVV